MFDFAQARRMMVDGQVRTADVTDLALIEAMSAVPRERFVEPNQTALAYLDLDLPLAALPGQGGRGMIKPMVLAKLIQAAGLDGNETVLDVGCATGYAATILSRLAGRVVALEEDGALASSAKDALSQLGTENVAVVTGPLVEGWPSDGPYDVILLEGATEVPPRSLFQQLQEGGRLLCVLGHSPGKAMLYRSAGGEVSGRPVFDAEAPLLPGFVKPPAFVF